MAESFFEVSVTHNQYRYAVLENTDSPASIHPAGTVVEEVQSSILNRFHVPKLQHGGMTCAPRRFACSCDPWCDAAVPCPKFCDGTRRRCSESELGAGRCKCCSLFPTPSLTGRFGSVHRMVKLLKTILYHIRNLFLANLTPQCSPSFLP